MGGWSRGQVGPYFLRRRTMRDEIRAAPISAAGWTPGFRSGARARPRLAARLPLSGVEIARSGQQLQSSWLRIKAHSLSGSRHLGLCNM